MVPVVALIGRHNVGKSTLFNRLTRTRDALVGEFPGLTRDRKYSRVEIKGREFICIDTAGIDEMESDVEMRMVEQSILAIEEADVVLFMVDARSGIMPADFTIAKHLRARGKTTFLLANKSDRINAEQVIIDFWSLGLGEICPIAASHGYGVTSFLETVLLPFIDKLSSLEEVDENVLHLAQIKKSKERKDSKSKVYFPKQDLLIKLAVVGRPNVGKSTFINRVLGEERVVVYEIPGTTRDSVYIPMYRFDRKYLLIDTAGVLKRGKITSFTEQFSMIKTIQAIENSNVVLLMIDAREGLSNQDLSLLSFIINSGRSLVVAINKWDGLNDKIRSQIKENINYRLGFINFARMHFISALHGSGINNLFKSVGEAYDSSTCRRSASTLTRIMQMAVKDHQPPLIRGRYAKLKYAHAGGYNPPIVVIHGNQVKDLPNSYKRYLITYFRESLDIIGTPIRIHFKEGNNPFNCKGKIFKPR